MDQGQPVRLSEDYFIATDKAQPPQISIDRPRGDYRANPIEEVTLAVKAADQYGLRDVHLHYSVNGGAERDISLLEKPGTKSTDGSHTLPLEDFKLVPGDVVSVYASARDGHGPPAQEMPARTNRYRSPPISRATPASAFLRRRTASSVLVAAIAL